MSELVTYEQIRANTQNRATPWDDNSKIYIYEITTNDADKFRLPSILSFFEPTLFSPSEQQN
jgi:hypothetical protein